MLSPAFFPLTITVILNTLIPHSVVVFFSFSLTPSNSVTLVECPTV